MSQISAFVMRKKKNFTEALFIYRKTTKKTVMASCFSVSLLARVAVVEPIRVQLWLNVVNCMIESSNAPMSSTGSPLFFFITPHFVDPTFVASRTTQVLRAAKTVVKWFIIVDPLINSILINYLIDRLCTLGHAVLRVKKRKTEERQPCSPIIQHTHVKRRKRPRLRIVAIKRKRRRRRPHRIERPLSNMYPIMEIQMVAVPLALPSPTALVHYQQQQQQLPQHHPWYDLSLSEEALSTCCCS
ncbi:AEL_collapsed_G0029330.mRNA.1.CDS.1 [Saccharomyces cerevisiae]|nr:AEL_collapsed_G0029330.mRNA.1.CDS.1 [Saccharomyces cerevisiae]